MSDDIKREIAEWYEMHSDAVYKYILIMIQDPQQAQDLTQETFIKAYNAYHSFEKKANAKTWLFRIAHNVTVDFLRKQKPLMFFKETFSKDSNHLPEDVIQIKEASKELYKALGTLKKSHREVILLRKIKGFNIQETMEILGWSESKVKSTLYRAIPALEQKLTKEGYVDEKSI